MGKMKKQLLPSFFVLGLLLLMVGCQFFKKAVSAEPVEKISADTIRVYKDALDNLKVAQAKNSPFPDLMSLMGKISLTEDRTTTVPARVQGRIDSIYFASGERVSQGQVLATLFSPDFISAKEEYLQALRQQQAQSGGSKKKGGSFEADPSDFANLAQLSRKKLETMGLSPADIDGLASAPTNDSGKTLLVVRAPRSGVLIQKNAVLGNLVNTGDTLFMIGDLTKVWFSGDIYPEDLPKVKKNQEVYINVVGIDHELKGKVSFISPLVDPSTRSIKIRALIDNPKEALKADQYVQGNVVLEDKTALVVPTKAIVRTPEGLVAYKRVNSKTVEGKESGADFQRVPVQVGSEQNGKTAVISGLNDGEEIVIDGAWLLDAALNSTDLKAEGK
jgi:membrane fusion protein, copper/silver efflux system